jgi:hypothetical protein
MTTPSKSMRFVPLGDRFAELSVILLTLVALVAGWLLKSSIENRSLAFSSGNVTAQVPAGWLTMNPGGNEILHVTERAPGGFGTTYLIVTEPIPADATPGQVVSLLTLERGSSLTSYRVLDQKEVLVQGRQAIEIDYVYVESDANLSHSVIPVVVHGLDYVFIKGDQAVIVSYRADQSVFDTDMSRFIRFLVSVKY